MRLARRHLSLPISRALRLAAAAWQRTQSVQQPEDVTRRLSAPRAPAATTPPPSPSSHLRGNLLPPVLFGFHPRGTAARLTPPPRAAREPRVGSRCLVRGGSGVRHRDRSRRRCPAPVPARNSGPTRRPEDSPQAAPAPECGAAQRSYGPCAAGLKTSGALRTVGFCASMAGPRGEAGVATIEKMKGVVTTPRRDARIAGSLNRLPRTTASFPCLHGLDGSSCRCGRRSDVTNAARGEAHWLGLQRMHGEQK